MATLTKRIEALEAGAAATTGGDWRAWVLVALPGNTPNSYTMRKHDGTTHEVGQDEYAAICAGAAADGPGVIFLDR